MTTRTYDEDEIWVDDDLDETVEDEMEDEVFFDDCLEPDSEDELSFEFDSRPKSFTARQRIEMAREEKWLQENMADFDFELFEDFGDHQSAGYSH